MDDRIEVVLVEVAGFLTLLAGDNAVPAHVKEEALSLLDKIGALLAA